jgi:hypothetical protein
MSETFELPEHYELPQLPSLMEMHVRMTQMVADHLGPNGHRYLPGAGSGLPASGPRMATAPL